MDPSLYRDSRSTARRIHLLCRPTRGIEMTPKDYKYRIAQLKFQVKECQQALRAERDRGHRDGYNEARREFTNKLRELAGVDPL